MSDDGIGLYSLNIPSHSTLVKYNISADLYLIKLNYVKHVEVFKYSIYLRMMTI